MKLNMKWTATATLLSLCVVVLVGCLSVPLGDSEKATVDPKLVGFWQLTAPGDGNPALLSLQQFDSHAYLLTIYSYTSDATGINAKAESSYKAWITPVGDSRFLTLASMDPARLTTDDPEKDRYTIVRLTATDSTISVQNTDDDFLKDCQNSDQLLKRISDNLNNPALFGSEKIDAYQKAPSDLVQKVLKAFSAN